MDSVETMEGPLTLGSTQGWTVSGHGQEAYHSPSCTIRNASLPQPSLTIWLLGFRLRTSHVGAGKARSLVSLAPGCPHCEGHFPPTVKSCLPLRRPGSPLASERSPSRGLVFGALLTLTFYFLLNFQDLDHPFPRIVMLQTSQTYGYTGCSGTRT